MSQSNSNISDVSNSSPPTKTVLPPPRVEEEEVSSRRVFWPKTRAECREYKKDFLRRLGKPCDDEALDRAEREGAAAAEERAARERIEAISGGVEKPSNWREIEEEEFNKRHAEFNKMMKRLEDGLVKKGYMKSKE